MTHQSVRPLRCWAWLVLVAWFSHAAQGQEQRLWWHFNPPGSQHGQIIDEVISRLDANERQNAFTPGESAVNYCHEGTHQLNSKIRLRFGAGRNAFYVGGDNGLCAILIEPRVTLSAVAQYVPRQFRSNSAYGLYLGTQCQWWNDQPLYVLDEWVSYTNGCQCALERGISESKTFENMQLFCHFADALVAAVQQRDSSYPQMSQLVEFVDWQKKRVQGLIGGGSAPAAQCVDGTCYRQTWVQRNPPAQWQPIRNEPRPQSPSPQPRPDHEQIKKDWLVYIDQTIDVKLKGLKPCECDPSKQVSQDEFASLANQVGILAENTTKLSQSVEAMANSSSETKSQLVKIEARLTAMENKKPAEPPPPSKGEQHIVIVADRNASWWQRLSEDIEKTKDTYVGIRVAPVPEDYTGEIPTAVVYEGSIAVRVVPGERNVLDLLSRIRRGMSI